MRSSASSASLGRDGRFFSSFAVALTLLLALALPSALRAQTVFGQVVEDGSRAGVEGVDLALLDMADSVVARALSDSTGAFSLPAPWAGTFRIRANRLGYSPLRAQVEMETGEVLEVVLLMSTQAIPLEPIVVVGRRQIEEGTLAQFYDRMARNKQAGKGQFLTIDQIENRTQMTLPLLLQTLPGVYAPDPVRGTAVQLMNPAPAGGMFCTPEFFLDGRPMLGGLRDITLLDMEGVEVYRGYEESVAGEFPNRCGQVFLWRKNEWGHAFSWVRLGGLVGLGAVLAGISLFF